MDAACNQESSKNRVGRHSTAPRLDLTPELSAARRAVGVLGAHGDARENGKAPQKGSECCEIESIVEKAKAQKRQGQNAE